MFLAIASLAAFWATTSLAQTTTDCNPLNSTCPSDPALGTTYATQFNATMQEFPSQYWNVTAGTSLISFGDTNGADLSLQTSTDTVTIKSNFYIFFGTVSIVMKAAPGTGIISTIILLSDDLDEVDWEIMGGNSTTVENNYYGWGNTSQYNSKYPALDGAQDSYHNYTINWSQEKIQWILDDNVVREAGYEEPGMYPQTPCRVQFGVWCGGCSESEGTVEWAGGKSDFTDAPFNMYVKSISITDGTQNASSYSYSDNSGSYKSINVTEGESDAYKALHKLTTVEEAEEHWSGLSTGAKIGIAVGVLGGLAIALLAFIFYCVKQRRAGRAEAVKQGQEWDDQNDELMEYRSMMAKGNFAVSRQSILMDANSQRGSRRFSKF
ncbi:glycoside hydrolase family 16 [Lecanosticta acicola]|uniref:chitinase n=1 Tax=Lecanosticta acicola TaxID=111012 RepID=A0AAI8YX34_9PEZI|nr:glycoside hydrolase family 16 [Lecanosticta acicola]